MPTGSTAEARPRLIAIAGPSCAGKTTLARALGARLAAITLPLDAYYRDFSALPADAKAAFNFDAPDALDRDRLADDLRQLAAGRAVDIPIYDFATHSRRSATRRLTPGAHLVVEGLFALYWPALNDLYQLKIFITAPDAVCRQRRLARDTAERGRTPASVRDQYQDQVRPSYQRFIAPTASRADLRLDGRAPLAELTATTLAHLRRTIAPKSNSGPGAI